MTEKYSMKIERTIVDDLGLKMYDKVSAVIAELIANSYDADAEKVIIKIPLGKKLVSKKDGKITQAGYKIEVVDDGHGMTPEEANGFFLKVGRHRRGPSGKDDRSKGKRRRVMGRKGLGKLAPFGVCKKIEVRSAGGKKTPKGHVVSHFEMDYDEIVKKTERDPDYHPDALSDNESWDENLGTRIILKEFYAKQVPDRGTFSRQLSYRFGLGRPDFSIEVIDIKEDPEPEKPFMIKEEDVPTMEGTKIIVDDISVKTEDGKELPVRGWVGMAKQSYKNEEFAGVRIYVRGKIASTTRDFGMPAGFQGEYVARSYLVGIVHADWLDDDEDLIQTHRQDILWTSERGEALSKWGKELIKKVARRGREPRQEKVKNKFLKVSSLKTIAKERFNEEKLEKAAMELGEKIGKFAHEDELQDEEYVKGLSEIVLTVAPYKLLVDKLKSVRDSEKEGEIDVKKLVEIFETVKIAEFSSYGQIVSERLNVIGLLDKLKEKGETPEIEYQKILQKSPWIIEPRWVPLTANETFETFRKNFEDWYEKRYGKKIVTSTEIQDKTKRPDFIMLSLENRVIIVEIKKPSHEFDDEDFERLNRYHDAIENYLKENDYEEHFQNKFKIVLIADYEKLGSMQKKAMDEIKKNDKLTMLTWDVLLTNVKKVYESFIAKRSSLFRGFNDRD